MRVFKRNSDFVLTNTGHNKKIHWEQETVTTIDSTGHNGKAKKKRLFGSTGHNLKTGTINFFRAALVSIKIVEENIEKGKHFLGSTVEIRNYILAKICIKLFKVSKTKCI